MVIRLSTLTAILVSVLCAAIFLARSASPMIRLYRSIAFSALACWWAAASFRHRRRPTSAILAIAASRCRRTSSPDGVASLLGGITTFDFDPLS